MVKQHIIQVVRSAGTNKNRQTVHCGSSFHSQSKRKLPNWDTGLVFCILELILQEEGVWRLVHGILKANLLFLFCVPEDASITAPCVILIMEDCYIELCDDNTTARAYSFQIVYKTLVSLILMRSVKKFMSSLCFM